MSKNSPETNSQKSLCLNCGWQVHLYVCVFALERVCAWQREMCKLIKNVVFKNLTRNSCEEEKHTHLVKTALALNSSINTVSLPCFFFFPLSSVSLGPEYSIKCLVKRKIHSWTFTPAFLILLCSVEVGSTKFFFPETSEKRAVMTMCGAARLSVNEKPALSVNWQDSCHGDGRTLHVLYLLLQNKSHSKKKIKNPLLDSAGC